MLKVDHLTIAVKNLEAAAKLFSQHGFTLKKPHSFEKGHQKGLTMQSIRLSSGQYLELVSVTKPQGQLALWYQNFLKEQEGGAFLIFQNSKLKELRKDFKDAGIESQFFDLPGYQWLSFKKGSDLENIAFINYKETTPQKPGVEDHQNLSYQFSKIKIKAKGDAQLWAKIFTLGNLHQSEIVFDHLTYKSGEFISEVAINSKGTQSQSFFIGKTKIQLISK